MMLRDLSAMVRVHTSTVLECEKEVYMWKTVLAYKCTDNFIIKICEWPSVSVYPGCACMFEIGKSVSSLCKIVSQVPTLHSATGTGEAGGADLHCARVQGDAHGSGCRKTNKRESKKHRLELNHAYKETRPPWYQVLLRTLLLDVRQVFVCLLYRFSCLIGCASS